jgi:hypothetical protein
MVLLNTFYSHCNINKFKLTFKLKLKILYDSVLVRWLKPALPSYDKFVLIMLYYVMNTSGFSPPVLSFALTSHFTGCYVSQRVVRRNMSFDFIAQ